MATYTPYVDYNISTDGKPVEITSWAERQKYFKTQWKDDFQIRVEEKEPKPKGWESARLDRAEERRKRINASR